MTTSALHHKLRQLSDFKNMDSKTFDRSLVDLQNIQKISVDLFDSSILCLRAPRIAIVRLLSIPIHSEEYKNFVIFYLCCLFETKALEYASNNRNKFDMVISKRTVSQFLNVISQPISKDVLMQRSKSALSIIYDNSSKFYGFKFNIVDFIFSISMRDLVMAFGVSEDQKRRWKESHLEQNKLANDILFDLNLYSSIYLQLDSKEFFLHTMKSHENLSADMYDYFFGVAFDSLLSLVYLGYLLPSQTCGESCLHEESESLVYSKVKDYQMKSSITFQLFDEALSSRFSSVTDLNEAMNSSHFVTELLQDNYTILHNFTQDNLFLRNLMDINSIPDNAYVQDQSLERKRKFIVDPDLAMTGDDSDSKKKAKSDHYDSEPSISKISPIFDNQSILQHENQDAIEENFHGKLRRHMKLKCFTKIMIREVDIQAEALPMPINEHPEQAETWTVDQVQECKYVQ